MSISKFSPVHFRRRWIRMLVTDMDKSEFGGESPLISRDSGYQTFGAVREQSAIR